MSHSTVPTTVPTEPPPKRDDGTGLIAVDPWLAPYADDLRHRYSRYQRTLARIAEAGGSLDAFTRGYEYFGFNRGWNGEQRGIWYREWAPAANALFLIGNFNNWDRSSHPLTRDEFGVWSIFLPDEQYAAKLVHEDHVKVHVHSAIGNLDRVPAYCRRVLYDPVTHNAVGQYWKPPQDHEWQHSCPAIRGGLRVYEAHVGMAQQEARVGTFREFTEKVLPRIANGGYNAIQLMAIAEHPYYASFGYHVSSFYAVCSRFGTPEDFKLLVDTAHKLGLRVLLDLVHSHAVKNVHDGLNKFDGTDFQYFHAGARGQHPAWDSLLFDYDKIEVLRFLLSNVRFWLEEYHVDGFRFDGVTSMMYLDHGLGHGFHSYDDYLKPHNLDQPAITYLQLANFVAHEANPQAITIAEDVSGMVGLARPLEEGGMGFNYRLAMGVPDYWIKMLKDRADEQWQMDEFFGTLMNRRSSEKHIAYAESHDQALVGDKTLAFWLMDADMYWHMSKATPPNMVIERGIALHKMFRLITFTLGGEGYLNFMGNEFGHPEWIDFPRQGNNYSFKYARRQWSLVDDSVLRYGDLAAFDRAMMHLDEAYDLLNDPLIEKIQVHEDWKLLIYRRGPLVFVFNWHANHSAVDYRIGVPDAHDYQLILNTDEFWFGGHNVVRVGQDYPRQTVPWDGREQSIQIYIPCRTAQILAPKGMNRL